MQDKDTTTQRDKKVLVVVATNASLECSRVSEHFSKCIDQTMSWETLFKFVFLLIDYRQQANECLLVNLWHV
jgi:hypothetical protein